MVVPSVPPSRAIWVWVLWREGEKKRRRTERRRRERERPAEDGHIPPRPKETKPTPPGGCRSARSVGSSVGVSACRSLPSPRCAPLSSLWGVFLSLFPGVDTHGFVLSSGAKRFTIDDGFGCAFCVGLETTRLACAVDSLVRVTRRVNGVPVSGFYSLYQKRKRGQHARTHTHAAAGRERDRPAHTQSVWGAPFNPWTCVCRGGVCLLHFCSSLFTGPMVCWCVSFLSCGRCRPLCALAELAHTDARRGRTAHRKRLPCGV